MCKYLFAIGFSFLFFALSLLERGYFSNHVPFEAAHVMSFVLIKIPLVQCRLGDFAHRHIILLKYLRVRLSSTQMVIISDIVNLLVANI